MQLIKQTLFTNWNFMRLLRLGFGVFFVIQAIQMHDAFMGIIGGFFLFTSLTNTGCCAARNCATPVRRKKSDQPEEIQFEEVKNS